MNRFIQTHKRRTVRDSRILNSDLDMITNRFGVDFLGAGWRKSEEEHGQSFGV